MRILILILFGLLFSQGDSLAQGNSPSEDVRKLKNGGTLVVVLHSNSLLINRLKEKSFYKQADEEEKLQKEKNERIVNAFKDHYSFSNLAFCDIANLQSVLDGTGFHLLKSDALTPLGASVSINEDGLFFCDPENIFMEHVEQGSLYKGMSILDKSYKNLRKPFPYFVRKHEGIFFLKRSEEEMVKLLEKKLNRFYLKGK